MAEMMKDAFTWAFGQLKTHNGRTVTYRRGNASVSLTAMVGGRQPVPLNTQALDRQPEDLTTPPADEYQRDYLILPADLVIAGSRVEPAVGDLIDDTNDETGVTHRYQVIMLPGVPEYEKRDYLVWLRIHARHIKRLTE